MASRFTAVINEEISQKKLKKLFPEKHEEGDELWFVRVKICLFNWNLSMKSVKKFFCFQTQIKSYVTVFSWHINK